VRSALSRMRSSSAADSTLFMLAKLPLLYHSRIVDEMSGQGAQAYAAQLGADTTFHREAAGGTRCS
jgi:hypothetical protein